MAFCFTNNRKRIEGRSKQLWITMATKLNKNRKYTCFHSGSRFQSLNITNRTVSQQIATNYKCRARNCSTINKMHRHSTSWKHRSVLSKTTEVGSKLGYFSSAKGYTILFIKIPFLEKCPQFPRTNQKQTALMGLEWEMLRKVAIKKTKQI